MKCKNMSRCTDLHVSLPVQAAKALARLARERGMKRSEALRLAVDRLLADAEREARDAEMWAYVERMAPYSTGFVRETSREVARRLRGDTKW